MKNSVCQSGGVALRGHGPLLGPSISLGRFPEGRALGIAKGMCLACPLCELTRGVNAWHTERKRGEAGPGPACPTLPLPGPSPRQTTSPKTHPSRLEDFRLPVNCGFESVVIVAKIVNWIEEMGHENIIVKCDNEPSILQVQS